MNRGYKRADRVGGLLRQELSELLLRAVKDPRLEHVTITAVRVSDDLRHARIFYNTAVATHPRQEVQAGLERAAGFLRRQIAQRLDLRYAPELSFRYDESFDRGAHLDAVLAALDGPEEGP